MHVRWILDVAAAKPDGNDDFTEVECRQARKSSGASIIPYHWTETETRKILIVKLTNLSSVHGNLV